MKFWQALANFEGTLNAPFEGALKALPTSVLYLGWRCTGLSSWKPWANWHLPP